MNTTKPNTILKAKNLSIGYKTKKGEAVISQNINFELEKGQLIGLVGANGIGKSTLLRTLIKVQPALSGTVLLNGTDLKTISSLDLAKQLSIVLTETLTSKNLSVYELIALGRHPYTNWVGSLTSKDIEIVENAFKLVNISELRNKK